MLDADAFEELVREIQAQGYDEETAGQYAVIVGDTPIMDEHRNVLVMKGDVVVAKLKPLAIFEH